MTHKLIHTPDYLLVVDDSEIKEGDFVLVSCSELEVIETLKVKGYYNEQFLFDDGSQIHMDYCKKVIAHLPLNSSPILTRVDLLPPLEQEDDVEKMAEKLSKEYSVHETAQDDVYQGIIVGFNKAREKYKFTEEDIRKSIAIGFDWCHQKYMPDDLMIDNFIQSLSQPKMPVAFECETITMNKGYTNKKDYPYQECQIPKTTTNSQGQTVWVGKYIF